MKTNFNITNKRSHKRYKLEHDFEIITDNFKIHSQIKDISCGGVFCQTDRFIPLNTELNVRLHLPVFIDRRKIDNEISCAAKVARIDPLTKKQDTKYDLGISFSKVSDKDKNLILKFVKQRNANEAKELKAMFHSLKRMVDDLSILEEAHLKAENFIKVLDQAIGELESVASILDAEIEELKHLN